MKANTRLFGEIDIDEEKIITLENGMIGFPDLRKFTLIFDKEKERTPSSIMWFQSMDEPEVAFPVMHPNELKPDYAPSVSDEIPPEFFTPGHATLCAYAVLAVVSNCYPPV